MEIGFISYLSKHILIWKSWVSKMDQLKWIDKSKKMYSRRFTLKYSSEFHNSDSMTTMDLSYMLHVICIHITYSLVFLHHFSSNTISNWNDFAKNVKPKNLCIMIPFKWWICETTLMGCYSWIIFFRFFCSFYFS